jgi:thiamine biosynthesis lipoprotein
VYLDAGRGTVRFTAPGVELNLGCIGKGYALDRCGELMREAGVDDFLLHGGNSSVLARGSHAARPGDGWTVGVHNPLRPQRRLGEICLRGRCLATSGSGTQFFMHRGHRYGHILDPRTGWPAEGVLSVTVLAPTAAEADGLATAMYVMGLQRSLEFCRVHPEVGFIMLCPGEKSGSLRLHRAGIDEADWRLLDDSFGVS